VAAAPDVGESDVTTVELIRRSAATAACALAACSSGGSRERLPICTTVAACAANDGKSVTVVGTYRLYPDLPGFDYTGIPRAVQIALDDGPGPFLEPYWNQAAIRPDAEVTRYLGKKVRVTGRYYRVQPRNPDDPPQASAMGGPCIHPVDRIEPIE
jgi:hypothetical protein